MSRKIDSKNTPSSFDHGSSFDLLTHFGMVSDALERRRLEQVLERGGNFWMYKNLATSNVKAGDVFGLLQSSPIINAPRTGHLGNTHRRITQGGGRDLVINHIVADHNLGYPLIFDLNQTSDSLYNPGFSTNGHGEEPLSLYHWDRSKFVPIQNGEAFLSPFTMALTSEGLTPLKIIHNQERENLYGGKLEYFSEALIKRRAEVRTIFTHLLNFASQIAGTSTDGEGIIDARKMIKNIFDRSVNISGDITDGSIIINHLGTILFNNKEYGENNMDELVDLCMLPLEIAANPELLKYPQELPNKFPFLSKEMIAALIAVLNLDFYSDKSALTPINPHIHLGAFQMAGVPPVEDGYFENSQADVGTLINNMRAAGLADQIPPVAYVLVPAGVLTLFPSEGHPFDIEAVTELMKRIHESSDHLQKNLMSQRKAIARTSLDWYQEYINRMSQNFGSRFVRAIPDALPNSPHMVKPEGFDTLTFSQLSTVVGFLRYFGGMMYDPPSAKLKQGIERYLN